MNIQEATVDWSETYDNDPTLRVVVDKAPDLNSLPHVAVPLDGATMYVALQDGVCHFLYSNGDKSGYGGRVFDLTMADGSVKQVKGPWSSRAGVVNSLGLLGWPGVVEVHHKETEGDYPDLWYHGMSLSVDLVEPHLPDGIELVPVGSSKVRYIPQWDRKGPKPDSVKGQHYVAGEDWYKTMQRLGLQRVYDNNHRFTGWETT